MPSIKRTGVKSQVVKTGFEAYEGAEPTRRGFYRARITRFNYKEFSTKAVGYAITLVFEADSKNDPKGNKQFDGYPLSGNIVLGDKEAMITRENNLYAALGIKDEPTVVFEEGDPTQGVKITKIGGKNPIGLFVNADFRMGEYLGSPRGELDGIYVIKAAAAAGKAVVADDDEDDESDITEEDEAEESEEDEEVAAREVELTKLTLAKLRAEAKALDLDVSGLKKDEIISAILDAEFGEEEEEDADDEEEEDADSEEEDDEEEEDEDDEEGARREELSTLSRDELKKILKTADPKATILKRHTEEDLINSIVAAEVGDSTPF